MGVKRLLALFVCAALALPASAQNVDLSPAKWPAGDLRKYTDLHLSTNRRHPLVTSEEGVVVGTTGALAVRAGVEALRQGGSAADAAMTTALTQITLSAGSAVSYAGVLSMIYWDAERRKPLSLNAEFNTVLGEDDPLSIPTDTPSGRTAMVPGFMSGVEAAHRRLGNLPWESLFGPAIYFAEEGFPLDDDLFFVMQSQAGILGRLPETRAIFFKPDGNLHQPGETFKQPRLAQTLRRVARQGAGYMIDGEWGERFVAAVAAEGGKMAMADLESYGVVWRKGRRVKYRGHQVRAPSRPGAGGQLASIAFKRLRPHNLARLGHYSESADSLFALMSATRAVYDVVPLLGSHSDGVIAVDSAGNVAVLLHSINTFAWGKTGIFVDGVSIPDAAATQQRRIRAAGPGSRIWSGTNPMLVLEKRRPVAAVVGIGRGLFEETVQTIVNYIDYGLDPEEAQNAPTFRAPRRLETPVAEWPTIVTRNDFSNDLIESMRARGIPILLAERFNFEATGFVVGVTIDPETGEIAAASPGLFNGLALAQ